MPRIVATIVTYFPEPESLRRLVNVVGRQVDKVIIVDNTSNNLSIDNSGFSHAVQWITNPSNAGVATAYNQGIAVAQKNEASHVVLFDQDSLPAPDMIKTLLEEWKKAKKEGLKIAALGPSYTDNKKIGQQESPFVKIDGFSLQRVNCTAGESVAVDHLISSGCLIDLNSFNDIGNFEEQLFIDYVDTEWCLRARRKNYMLLGVGSAKMEHSLGDKYLHVLHKHIPLHSPLRHYYLMRNGAWLISQSWVGWRWRIIDSKRLIKVFIAFSLFTNARWAHCKMMTLGIIHYFRGKTGKF